VTDRYLLGAIAGACGQDDDVTDIERWFMNKLAGSNFSPRDVQQNWHIGDRFANARNRRRVPIKRIV